MLLGAIWLVIGPLAASMEGFLLNCMSVATDMRSECSRRAFRIFFYCARMSDIGLHLCWKGLPGYQGIALSFPTALNIERVARQEEVPRQIAPIVCHFALSLKVDF